MQPNSFVFPSSFYGVNSSRIHRSCLQYIGLLKPRAVMFLFFKSVLPASDLLSSKHVTAVSPQPVVPVNFSPPSAHTQWSPVNLSHPSARSQWSTVLWGPLDLAVMLLAVGIFLDSLLRFVTFTIFEYFIELCNLLLSIVAQLLPSPMLDGFHCPGLVVEFFALYTVW